MDAVLDTLVVYMKPIGVCVTAKSLVCAVEALNVLCRQVARPRISLEAFLAKFTLTAPGVLNGWTIADALWLAACKRSPEIALYSLGEITERAFKRTMIWLAVYSGQTTPCALNSGADILNKNIHKAIEKRKEDGVLTFFLTEYFYEICRDSQRRLKTETEKDLCYLYHFPKGKKPRSIAEERREQNDQLEHCRKLAQDILPAVQESLHSRRAAPLEREFTRMYRLSTGRSPKPEKMKTPRKPPLNVVVGKSKWSDLKRRFTIDPEAVRFLLHTKDANIAFDRKVIETFLSKLTDKEGFQLHSLSKDLLDIGVVMYMADQAVKRGRALNRRLDILMPVRHLALWNKIKEPLTEAVSFLGRDDVHFHFIKNKKKGEKTDPVRFTQDPRRRCVSLFSGGLDSAAGAVRLLIRGWEPVFVSHHPNAFTSHLQKTLLDELKRRSKRSPDWLNLFVARSKSRHASNPLDDFPDSPMPQFLRSFLFLSVAAVAAVETGIDRVYVFENGPIALNPIFSEARLNTRTAHPRFLAVFQHLFFSLFKVNLRVCNPFLNRTKGEVVRQLSKPRYRGLVRKTNSCWNSFAVPIRGKRMKRTERVYHDDGDCLPCVIRRLAVHHADLADDDVPYLVNVFKKFLSLNPGTRVMLADYVRFCTGLKTLNNAALLLDSPDFSVYAPAVDPSSLVSMYRRHADEVLKGFRELSSPEIACLLIPPVN